MHLLPTNLGRLADLTREGYSRFALDGVKLRLYADNHFVAEATDEKVLLRLMGPCVAPAEDYPDCVPGLADAPNGKCEALVPAAAWKKAFAGAKKLTARVRTAHLNAVAVKVGEKVATFAATNGTAHQCETVGNLEGEFPRTDVVLAAAERGAPRARFGVDPLLLADLLRTIADTTCDPEHMRVDFEVRRPDKAILIKATNGTNGMEARAIIVPLLADTEPATAPASESASEGASEGAEPLPTDVVELQKRNTLLACERDMAKELAADREKRCREVTEENDALRAEIRNLRDLLATREDRIAELTRGTPTHATAHPQPQQQPAPARPLTRAERLAALKGDAK